MDIDILKQQFVSVYCGSEEDILIFFSPGRVNLIGEHIDYNGGYVFPAALTLGIYGAVRFREDRVIGLKSLNAHGELLFDLDDEIIYNQAEDWCNYPKGVINQLKKQNYKLTGADILFYGDLPDGAGLSSSAAIEVLTAYIMLYNSYGDEIDRINMAKLCQHVENSFIGVNCGIMDQFSVAMGKKDCALLLDCNTLNYKYAPLKLNDVSLVIINTNKRRELAESKYNERRSECEGALAILKNHREISNLCEATMEEIEQYIVDELLYKRARHVVEENQRVLRAVEVLEIGELKEFGKLMVESHMSLKDNYQVTGIELDTIVEEAMKVDGCLGCRMTGAGFGGCAIALVRKEKLEEFRQKVSDAYNNKTKRKADFYICKPGDGVHFVC